MRSKLLWPGTALLGGLLLFGCQGPGPGPGAGQGPSPPARPATVEMTLAPFGSSAKAEIYVQQTNPAAAGTHVPLRDAGRVVYLVEPALLTSSEIADVRVTDSSFDVGSKRVTATLTAGGRAACAALVQSSSPAHPLALAWKDEVWFRYRATDCARADGFVVADGIEPTIAVALAAALR